PSGNAYDIRGQADLEQADPDLARTIEEVRRTGRYQGRLADALNDLVDAAVEMLKTGRQPVLSATQQSQFGGFLLAATNLLGSSRKLQGVDTRRVYINPHEVLQRALRDVNDLAERFPGEFGPDTPNLRENLVDKFIGRLFGTTAHEVLHPAYNSKTHPESSGHPGEIFDEDDPRSLVSRVKA